MKIILSFFILIAMSTMTYAVDLPSELSGTYVGTGALTGWTCDMRAYALQPSGLTTRVLLADCATPAGRVIGSVSIWDACPSTDATQPAMTPFGTIPTPSTPHMAILAYAPGGCTLGALGVSIGGGSVATLCRTQITIPTFTYPGCGATAPRHRVRVFDH